MCNVAEKDEQTFENIKMLERLPNETALEPEDFWLLRRRVYKSGSRQGNGPAPASGAFRSKLGRLIFKTEGLEQNLVEPNFVENRVAFELFGCLPGEVKLRGTFEQSKAHDSSENGYGAVRFADV